MEEYNTAVTLHFLGKQNEEFFRGAAMVLAILICFVFKLYFTTTLKLLCIQS